MFHVKTILSVAVSMAMYTTMFPSAVSASSVNDQILLASNQTAQRSVQTYNSQRTTTSRSIQQQDRTRDRLREDPKGTPNENPPSKAAGVELQSDQQHDRIRDRLREDPKGTPNENPPSKED